jgi:hypothetical protein
MKLTKKSGGVVAAVVMAGGLTAASASSAFASAPAHGPKTTPVAKDADQHKTAKTHTGRHHRTGTHGERTVKGKDGKTVVHEWQIGTVTAVGGSTVTVKSTDGFTLTWTTGSAAKVRAGDRGTQVKVGDKVLVEGVKAGAVNQARVVLDHTAQQADRNDKDADHDGNGRQDTEKDKAPTGKHRKAGAPQTGEGTGQRDA